MTNFNLERMVNEIMMLKKGLFSALIFLIWTGIFSDVQGQQFFPASKIKAQKERLIQTQVPVSDIFLQQLDTLQWWLNQHVSQKAELQPYYLLLEEYLNNITPLTYRKYAEAVHNDIISFALPLYQEVLKNPSEAGPFIGSQLPDEYCGIKILVPSAIAYPWVMQLAESQPAQLIGQFSSLDYAPDDRDLLAAVIRHPGQVKQFLHYSNNVKKSLEKSNNDTIKLILSIYQKFRYSPNPYYFLPYIKAGKISMEEAEAKGREESVLMNYLTSQILSEELLGSATVTEKWNQLTGSLLSKIKSQKQIPVNSWQLPLMENASDTTRVVTLFLLQGMMDPRETESYMKWLLLRNYLKPLSPGLLNGLPLKTILQLKSRTEEQKLTDAWGALWGADTLKTYLESRKVKEKVTDLSAKKEIAKFDNPRELKVNLPVRTKVPEFVIQNYIFQLSDDEKRYIKLSNDPIDALEEVKNWIDKPFASKLLKQIAAQYPLEVVQHLDEIKLKPAGIEALKTVGIAAPLTAKNFIIYQGHPWANLFKTSKDSVLKLLFTINENVGINSRAYLLMDEIYRKEITIAEADSFCKNTALLIPHLIKIIRRPDAIGRYSVEQELTAKALNFVRNFNISENTDHYYAEQLKMLSADQLYHYITYGEDEIIERTFLKMFAELLSKAPDGNVYTLMERNGFNNFRKFVRKCAFYNVTDRLMASMLPTQRELFAVKILQSLELEREAESINIAEIILYLQNKELSELLHQQLKKEYERCEKARLDKGVAVYGILSALLGQRIENGWATYVADKYDLPDLNTLPAYQLFNQDLANVQQYYFYKDEDGIGSYNNFIRSYQKSPLEWDIKDMGKFVLIQSKMGRKVEIFANKATDGEEGIQAMLLFMKTQKLEPQVVVHRGLSTHTLKTFNRMPSSARLILDGSCGGYHVQQVAIKNAPDAMILCNRNIGTMHVNDPIFKQISDDIRSGKDLFWPDFWDKMKTRVGTNPYFKDYIPPHKNAGVILYKTLYEILEIE